MKAILPSSPVGQEPAPPKKPLRAGLIAADLRGLEDSRIDLARCVVLPQHGQGHDLGHLRLRGTADLLQGGEGGCGAVKAGHGFAHGTPGEVGDAGRPGGHGSDLGGAHVAGPCGRLRRQQAQGLGRHHGARGIGMPGGVTGVLQSPGQGQTLLGRRGGRGLGRVGGQAREPLGRRVGRFCNIGRHCGICRHCRHCLHCRTRCVCRV